MKTPTFTAISYSDWRRQVESQPLVSHVDGVDLEALCTALHPERSSAWEVPPGLNASSRDATSWIPCQVFDNPDLKKLNHYLKSDLDGGVRGIWLRLDRVSRQGLDPLTSEAVGKAGAALYRKADFASAFADTPPTWHTLLLDAGGSFLPATAALWAWLRDSGQDLETRTLLLGADPLGTLARDGALPGSFDRMGEDLAALVDQSHSDWPRCRSVAVSTQAYREAGAEIDQELAISLSTGVEYLRALEQRGLEPEVTAAELVFITSTGQQIFTEIAKLRALRILWSQVLRACDVQPSSPPWIHAAVLRRCLPTREPSINLLRVTTASFAAGIGGVDSLEATAYDWFEHSGGSNRGHRLARNTQLILGLEAQIGRVIDPAAGSYSLETVTHELVARGWQLFQEIESQGGLLASLRSGWLQQAIATRWAERRQAIERVEIPLTGINIYQDPNAAYRGGQLVVAPEVQEEIRLRFAEQSKSRGGEMSNPTSSPSRWQWCAESAMQNRSIPQMCSALYGAETPLTVEPLHPHRDSEPFERGPAGP